jgi:hypothetical protein
MKGQSAPWAFRARPSGQAPGHEIFLTLFRPFGPDPRWRAKKRAARWPPPLRKHQAAGSLRLCFPPFLILTIPTSLFIVSCAAACAVSGEDICSSFFISLPSTAS